jgi:hypothetical protein
VINSTFPIGLSILFFVAGNLAIAQVPVEWAQGSIWQSSNYEVDYSRRYAPNSWEREGGASTRSAAESIVARLQRWDQQMAANGVWRDARLSRIRVTVKPGSDAPSTPGRPNSALTSWVNQVSQAYQRAREVRLDAERRANALTDSAFNNANQVIRSYRSLRAEGIRQFGASSFSRFPIVTDLGLYYDFQLRNSSRTYPRGPFTSSQSREADWRSILRQYPGSRRIRNYAM